MAETNTEHMMSLRSLLVAAAVVGVASGAGLAQSSDPLIGTWKLNVEKSKSMAFKSGTSTIERAGDGVKFTVDLMGADGTAYHWTFTAKYDAKDYPVTGNSPFGDAAALTRVDPHTTRITVKQGGKETATQTIIVSADGKTRTTTTKGTDVKGRPIDSTSFYEKQ
jgi:hypothetical protein